MDRQSDRRQRGNYTLFDDVRIHLVPRETAPESGQFRVFEYYETEHLQTLLKLDFYKGLGSRASDSEV